MIQSNVAELYDRCVDYYAEHTAIKQGSRDVSYAEMGRKANNLATALQELGVKKNEKIAFLITNSPEYIFCEYALAKSGAVKVPLATLLSPQDHVYMMNVAECTTLIYHQSMSERVSAMVPGLKTISRFICVAGLEGTGDLPPGHLLLNDLIGEGCRTPAKVDIELEDLVAIYFTGGTTGRPKGVMLSHRAFVETYAMQMLEFSVGWGERFLFSTPLTHASGFLMLPVLLRRGCCVLLDRFEPERYLQTVEKEQVSMTFLVPTMICTLLDHPSIERYDFSSLQNIIYGASSIAPERLKQAIKKFGPVMTQLFAQTEAPMILSVLSRAEHVIADSEQEKKIFSSAGRPALHAQLKLIDEEGNEVPRGEAGEITMRCGNLMSGYLNNPEATAQTIRNGWLHTGDVAFQDEQGFIYIVDRKKDMIISGGFNIYPREIEDVLHEHPAVRGAAVVGAPHPKWGEEVRAVVCIHDGGDADESELIRFVKERKGSLVVPKKVEFWDEIPLTPLGKIDKKEIRRMIAAR